MTDGRTDGRTDRENAVLVHQLQHGTEANLEQRLDADCDKEAAATRAYPNREIDEPGKQREHTYTHPPTQRAKGLERPGGRHGDAPSGRSGGTGAHQYIRLRVRSSASL